MEHTLLFSIPDLVFSNGVYEQGDNRLGSCKGFPIILDCRSHLLSAVLVLLIHESANVRALVNIHQSPDGEASHFGVFIAAAPHRALPVDATAKQLIHMIHPNMRCNPNDTVNRFVFGQTTDVPHRIITDVIKGFERHGEMCFVVGYTVAPEVYSIPHGPTPIIRATSYTEMTESDFFQSIKQGYAGE